MCSTSEQVYTAANNLTDNIGGFFSELLHLLFALIDTLVECAMHVCDSVASNPYLVVVLAVCYLYWCKRRYPKQQSKKKG